MDAASAFHQQGTVRGSQQPGQAAAHAGMEAGTSARLVDRGASRWDEFQEEVDGEEEPLEPSIVPSQHVEESAWHSSAAAADMPEKRFNFLTSYD